MSVTTTTRKTVVELLAEHAERLIPVEGDRAYTFYHGRPWEGVLKNCGGSWLIIPPNGQKGFGTRGIDMPYRPKGHEGMEDVASVGVYGPDSGCADLNDDWHEQIRDMGYETPNRFLAYDPTRAMFYLRACED